MCLHRSAKKGATFFIGALGGQGLGGLRLEGIGGLGFIGPLNNLRPIGLQYCVVEGLYELMWLQYKKVQKAL